MAEIKVYTVPTTTKEANQWLDRAGAKHVRFATVNEKAILRDTVSNKIYLKGESISDLCYSLAFQPILMKRFGIAGSDWYCPNEVWNHLKPVELNL